MARTEELIAGLGQEEALRRGNAYVEAGADALLIHSKQKTPDENLAFCQAWPGHAPLVLVPTSYPKLSFADVASLGKVGLIICGNHAIRAAGAAMQSTFRQILAEGGIAGVEADIATLPKYLLSKVMHKCGSWRKRICAKGSDHPRHAPPTSSSN